MGGTRRKPGIASRVGRPLLAGALAAAAAAPVAADAQQIFLRLDGIQGDSQDDKHKGEIEILSYTQSFSNTARLARGTSSGPGRVTCGAVTVLKTIDRSSPHLIRLVTTGAHVPQGLITFQQAAGKYSTEYYRIAMTDIVVTAVDQSDQPDPATIVEKVSILADQLTFEYRDSTSGTTTKFGWDCVTNKQF